MAYATKTTVSPEKSRLEIERTLMRYGAANFYYGSEPTRILIGFKVANRMIRIEMPLPDGKRMTPKSVEQVIRSRWRALALVIKAKLEAVSIGISTIEKEFLAYVMTADGSTVGAKLAPLLESEYQTGRPARFLLAPAEVAE